MRLRLAALAALACLAGACGAAPGVPVAGDTSPAPAGATPVPSTPPEATAAPPPDPATTPRSPAPEPPAPGTEPTPTPVAARPAWLGTRPLPLRPDGYGQVLDTPEELRDRRLPPPPLPVPPPRDPGTYEATIESVPGDVAARSTWSPECPVDLDDLRYLTVPFWGFDEAAHTGELLVHASAAEDLAEVFRRLFEARFPIEEMRVVAPPELDAPPTGDGNNTTAFVCRPVRGSSSWSQHAHGLAVDINPFHNPYVRGDLVLPELASAYADREWHRPGMIQPGDEVTEAFRSIGWGWGGDWTSLVDWMHFSSSGR